MASRIDDDVFVRGRLSMRTIDLPDGAVSDSDVAADAAIGAAKLEHQHAINYSQASGTTAAAETKVVHTVQGTAGSLVSIKAGMVTPCSGDATVTVDLHKNGSSILTSTITLDSTQTARELVTGTIDTATTADGDVLEIVITVSAGTGTLGSGVFAIVVAREDAE